MSTAIAISQGSLQNRLRIHLTEPHLPTVKEVFDEAARMAEAEHLSCEQYLLHVVERECEVRRTNGSDASFVTQGFHWRRPSRSSSVNDFHAHRMHSSRASWTAASWTGRRTCLFSVVQEAGRPICSVLLLMNSSRGTSGGSA